MLRISFASHALAVAALVAGIAVAYNALAHHPGSHAARISPAQARLDLLILAPAPCAAIASVRPGTPDGLTAPPRSVPVTVRTSNAAGECAGMPNILREAIVLDAPERAGHVHIYVTLADGTVALTQRVRIE